MAKRPRGKAEKKAEEKAKKHQSVDSALGGSAWGALENATEDHGYNDSDEEFDYESVPRKFQAFDSDEDVEKLPVKTLDGRVKRVVGKANAKKPVEPKKEESESEPEPVFEEEEYEDSETESLDSFGSDGVDMERQLVELKEKIADAASLLSEDPEEYISKLREVRELIALTKHVQLKQIVLLAMVPIFKGLIPGYRIRPLTETEKKEKVSTDVRKLRNFEESLLANYHGYITTLRDLSKRARGADVGSVRYVLGDVAVTASCELLESVPYFNFRDDLLHIVVDRLSSRRVDSSFERAIKSVEVVFKSDEEGHVSFELVRLLVKMIKVRKYKVEPIVLESLLHMRLLTELVAQADLEKVRGIETPKIKKKDRAHLTKREKKARKERKAIDEELRLAETAVSAEERDRLQGEALKLTFQLYFSILKERTNQLIGVVLEGLAKFAHLINAELFGDLLEVLRELILERQKRVVDGEYEFKESTTREALLCVVTAFALLSGQAGESMNLDLSFFINHFFSCLYSLALNPDVEFSHKTLRLDDPLAPSSTKPKVNISTETEMMVRAFEFIFLRQKAVSPIRVQAFAKRLATASLHMPDKSCLASLRILDKMNRKFSVLTNLYSTDDRVANGVYNMVIDDPDSTNPETTTVWETVLLESHYSPSVAQAARAVPRSAVQKAT